MACVDKAESHLKALMGITEKNILLEDKTDNKNTDVTTLLPLGSKVLVSMETLIASCPKKEISINVIECDTVESVTVDDKGGKESVSVNLNLLDASLRDGIKSSETCQLKVSVLNLPHKVAMECENWSENVEPESTGTLSDDLKIVIGDEKMKPSSLVLNSSLDDGETSIDVDTTNGSMKVEKIMVPLLEECQKEVANDSNGTGENDEVSFGIKKQTRGRKRKVQGSSECSQDLTSKKVKVENSGVKFNVRVLRSNTTSMSAGVKVDESRLNESVVSFKRQMDAECLDQTDFQKEVNGNRQPTGRPQNKRKHRGRPPKMQGEAVFKRKTKDKCFDQIELQREVNERSQLVCRSQKKQKRRGRPPKMQGENGFKRKMEDECLDQTDFQKKVNESSQLTSRPQKKPKSKRKNHKDTVIKNLKGRGRPPKVQAADLSTNIKNTNNNILKTKSVQNEGQESEIVGDNKQKVKISEESNDHTIVEDAVKDHDTNQIKSSSGGEDRRKKQ